MAAAHAGHGFLLRGHMLEPCADVQENLPTSLPSNAAVPSGRCSAPFLPNAAIGRRLAKRSANSQTQVCLAQVMLPLAHQEASWPAIGGIKETSLLATERKKGKDLCEFHFPLAQVDSSESSFGYHAGGSAPATLQTAMALGQGNQMAGLAHKYCS